MFVLGCSFTAHISRLKDPNQNKLHTETVKILIQCYVGKSSKYVDSPFWHGEGLHAVHLGHISNLFSSSANINFFIT